MTSCETQAGFVYRGRLDEWLEGGGMAEGVVRILSDTPIKVSPPGQTHTDSTPMLFRLYG